MGKNLPVPIRRRRGQPVRRASAGEYLSELAECLDRTTALGQPRVIRIECKPGCVISSRLAVQAVGRYVRIANLPASPSPAPHISLLA